MLNSAGMYQGIYTLTTAPVAQASYFIPTMGVKGTLVATYYTGSVGTPNSGTDLDTLSTVTVCFSGDHSHLFWFVFFFFTFHQEWWPFPTLTQHHLAAPAPSLFALLD